ncbi:MAG: hypothetical protein IPF64_00590 [Flavobacteriales bacterium]|nr:hypothetical protein [Flavobacteriales bacterium]
MSSENALLEALRYSIEHRLTFAAFRNPGGQATMWAQQTPELDRVENGLWWELNDVFPAGPLTTSRSAYPWSARMWSSLLAMPNQHWHRLMECTGSGRTPGPPTSDDASGLRGRRTRCPGTLPKR